MKSRKIRTINAPKLKPIFAAIEEVGALNVFLFLGSFILIFFFEDAKQLPAPISTRWIIIGIFAYTIFAVYFAWFFTHILPRQYKKYALLFYLRRRATDLAIAVGFVLLDLIEKSKIGDPNQRDRSDDELIEICRTINPFQRFSSHWERHDPYDDFYEYFSSIAIQMNITIEKMLFFSDILSQEQIQTLLKMENDTNSPLTKNIKFSAGMINNEPAPAFIPEAYAYVINRLRKNSQYLLDSFEIGGSVT